TVRQRLSFGLENPQKGQAVPAFPKPSPNTDESGENVIYKKTHRSVFPPSPGATAPQTPLSSVFSIFCLLKLCLLKLCLLKLSPDTVL
ncbi:MAG: hypothetical protein LBD06_01300, partial [Candidatus Accumulibacter sp.]|nr:hypothetical protein [Accumulibacter sp.]